MWESIVTILVKYWVEFLLGGIVTGGGLFFRRYAQLSKAERDQKRRESQEKLQEAIKEDNQRMIDEVSKMSKEEDEKLQKQINKINKDVGNIMIATSSMQKNDFYEKCHYLLKPDHFITLDEWEDIKEYHKEYNAIGGNHRGDNYFELIQKKVEANLGIKATEDK